MTQYIVLLPADEARYGSATDEARADLTAAHGEFVQLLAERGHKMTGGAQLMPSSQTRVVRGTGLDEVTVTDGPYAESAEQVGGYYVVETSDLDGPGQGLRAVVRHPVPPGCRDPPARRRHVRERHD